MQVRYVGVFADAQVQVGAQWVTCQHGETIDVPDDIAGRPPSDEHVEARTALAEVTARKEAGEVGLDQAQLDAIGAYHASDKGEGLLAQDENWQPGDHEEEPVFDPAANTVDEVTKWVGDDPGRAAQALAAEEQATHSRPTLIKRLAEIIQPTEDQ